MADSQYYKIDTRNNERRAIKLEDTGETNGDGDTLYAESSILAPSTSGGLSIYRSLSLLATGVSVKASAGQVYGYYIANNSNATRYIKFYNKATAPTVGTDTPVMTLPLPSGSAANVSHPHGLAFSLGIGLGATTGIADADTAAPSANDVVVNIYYK